MSDEVKIKRPDMIGNKRAVGNSGRPPKYKTVDEMQIVIDKYFEECKEEGRPYTVSGLAYALEIDRDTLLHYESKSEFYGTIKRAKQRIQAYAEETLYTIKNPAGAIFNLKANWGYRDQQDINMTVTSLSDVLKTLENK